MKSVLLPAVPQMIISFCFYLALLRGTNMGLFYPTSEAELGLIDYTTQTVMNLALLAGLFGYFFLENNYRLFVSALSRADIGLVVLGIGISLIFATDMLHALKYLLAVFIVTVPVFLYYKEFGADALLKAIANFMCIAAFANMAYLYAFPQYAIMTGNHEGAWRGLFEHKNPSGAVFGISAFVIFLQIDWRRKFSALLYMISIVICFLFAVFSHSSSAIVTTFIVGVCCALFYFIMRLGQAKERILVLLAAISLALLVYALAGDAIIAFIFKTIDRDPTLTGRTGIWEAALNLVAERPFIGFGPGATDQVDFFRKIQGEVGWDVKSMHNSFIDAIVNYGYPTALILFFIVLSTIGKSLTIIPASKKHLMRIVISLSLLVGMLVECFSETGGFLTRSIIWVMTVCAICGLSEPAPQKK